MKRILLSLFCLIPLSLPGCSSVGHALGGDVVSTSVTFEGTTYRSGFYGELYPVFGQVGDIGSDTLRKEILFTQGTRKFRRVDYEGHDWVHSYTGQYAGGVVYCAEDQWEQMREYYADPLNFAYYCGVGYYVFEKAVAIPEMDPQKLDELLAFGNENQYQPFDQRSNKKAEEKTRRIPKAEYQEGICFYKESNDGYFTTVKSPLYFVHEGKLLLVFYHDGGRDNGGIEEVVAIDVPDKLGQYFVDLAQRYLQE